MRGEENKNDKDVSVVAVGPDQRGGVAKVALGPHHEERRRHLSRVHDPVHGVPVHGGASILHQQGKAGGTYWQELSQMLMNMSIS